MKDKSQTVKSTSQGQSALDAYAQIYDLTVFRDNPSRALEEISAHLSRENAVKINNLQQALAQQPKDVTLRKVLFRSYVSQGEFPNAIRLGKRWLEFKGKDKRRRHAVRS